MEKSILEFFFPEIFLMQLCNIETVHPKTLLISHELVLSGPYNFRVKLIVRHHLVNMKLYMGDKVNFWMQVSILHIRIRTLSVKKFDTGQIQIVDTGLTKFVTIYKIVYVNKCSSHCKKYYTLSFMLVLTFKSNVKLLNTQNTQKQ